MHGGSARHGSDGEQSRVWESGGEGEKEAGEVPHPKAKLRLRIAATKQRRDGGCDSDRGAAAAACAARVLQGGGCEAGGSKGAVRRLYRAAERGLGVRARGAIRAEEVRRGRTRPRARVWLKVGDDPDRWAPPISKRKRGGERGVARLAGPGEEGEAEEAAGPRRR
jgi:hypothetical protein